MNRFPSTHHYGSLLVLVLSLLLPFSACDTVDPASSDPIQQPAGGSDGDSSDSDGGGGDETDNVDLEEGELGGSFAAKVEPISSLLGGVNAEFGGSAVFFDDSESGRTVMVLAHDDVLDAVYPFEFIVFSTPGGLPAPGTYPLSLDFDSSFMGGFVELRGTEQIDVELPFQEEVFALPPSTILQTFSGELVVTETSEDSIQGSFTFRGFPVDSEYVPLYVRGESTASGSFSAVAVSEADAPEIDIELYLPEDFILP
ncbi:MAG: hypothetical protein AAF624_04300 [Bacteroidota bacterium]